MVRNEDVASLYRLQETQAELRALDREIKEASETTAVADLLVRQQKFNKLQDALETKAKIAQRNVRSAEMQLHTAEDGQKAVTERLYGGTVTSSKELAQLEERLMSLQEEVSKREEAYLAALDVVDQLTQHSEKVDAGAAQLGAQLQAARERLSHKESEWDFRREGLELDEQDLRGALDPSLLRLYERKMKTTRLEPIAVVRHGVCGGCRMELPAAVRATHGRDVQSCEQCGRILFWPE